MGKFVDKITGTNNLTRQANRSNRQDNRQEWWSGVKDSVQRGKDAGTEVYNETAARLAAPSEFMPYYRGTLMVPCFRVAVNKRYFKIGTETARDEVDMNRDFNENATTIFQQEPEWSRNTLIECQAKAEKDKKNAAGTGAPGAGPVTQSIEGVDGGGISSPFDKRLERLFNENNETAIVRTPFSTKHAETSTVGLIATERLITESENVENSEELLKNIRHNKALLQKDKFYVGVPALMNTYALTKLYGSDGGEKLINKRGDRRWYEVDQAFGSASTTNGLHFASVPTTSSLISWGNEDPYGRTPYHFTDFAFAKYWNKIENNRLITLRRYAAPILDNMKFPGMQGDMTGDPPSSSSVILFPPMASAITYFGGDTGNNIGDLLKFTSGLKWDEAKSNVWNVDATSTPDLESGPGGGLFGRLASLSKMLNIAGGDFNAELLMNKGALPPDPYGDGMPYENRILGPVNRIDAVKKRAPGLDFQWDGLNLVFEYVARPIGGVNPKAVLLDILSNFLVIGSASAVFFGGQHRFMANPAIYPFLGGERGIKQWYQGKPIQWANESINAMAGEVSNPDGGIMEGAKNFFSQLFSAAKGGGIKGIFGAVEGLFTGGGIGSNVLKHHLAAKSAGTVPYLTGLRALLTGEPVGEWHVTIGNPLNPIAMIGNLICAGIEVEFGNELGPDDFPTEIKVTAKMEHGMARDRDAIQSIFNRGMGRIYDLPDEMEGTADEQTRVDRFTAESNESGTAALSRGWLAGPSTTGSKSGVPIIKTPSNKSETSVWAKMPFRAVSPNENIAKFDGDIARSQYRSVDWVALKSLI